MNARKPFTLTLAAALIAVFASACLAGPADPPGDLPLPGVGDEPATPEQLARLLEEARVGRLAMERRQVCAEIQGDLLFDPAQVAQAVKALDAGAANSWFDNIDRICRAFALVDGRFGKALALLRAGKPAEAAEALKPLISERDTTYHAAAKRFCLAEALAGQARHEDAVEAYTDMIKAMPDRFSFSAVALIKAAQIYEEKLHRRYNAMSLYRLWVDSFGLLDPKTADELAKRAESIAADYKDPLATLANKMNAVEKRLEAIDSGRSTQQKQKEIVDMLDDLIATAEENSQSQGQGQGQGEGEGEGEGKGKGQGKGQGQGQGQGQGSGPASGLGIPSSPATVSRLVGGDTVRPQGLSEIRPSDGSDDWGRLPPREREKLLETFKESMPERYREMIRDYYLRLARQRQPG